MYCVNYVSNAYTFPSLITSTPKPQISLFLSFIRKIQNQIYLNFILTFQQKF